MLFLKEELTHYRVRHPNCTPSPLCSRGGGVEFGCRTLYLTRKQRSAHASDYPALLPNEISKLCSAYAIPCANSFYRALLTGFWG